MTGSDHAAGGKSHGPKSQRAKPLGGKPQRLVAVTLDEKSIGRSGRHPHWS